MSNSTENYGNTPSVEASVNPYNTYGLATQGFVWAAISSVSGDWGKGHVKTVNDVHPDVNGNVQVSSISSLDYSGELNKINSDLTAIINGETGHRILSDSDYSNLKSYVNSISGEFDTRFESVCSLFPSEATSTNKLADKKYVDEQIRKEAPFYRGSWNTWNDVPNDASLYPEDYGGNKIPKVNDYLVVLDASSLSYVATVNRSLIGKTLAVAVLSFEVGHVLTESDISTLTTAGISTVTISRTGTWSFSYVGKWETVGKNGWNPEYEISKSAFTQEQWAAINSGITEGKLTNIENTSSSWNEVTEKVVETSGLWDRSSLEVFVNARKWNSTFTEVSATSANNRSVYASFQANSGLWNSAATTLNSLSATWNDASTEIQSTSSFNRSVYSTVESTSGGWNATTETVNTSSPNWSSVFTTVQAASAKWNESEGSTKAYTDMIGTSALTSANKYTDEKSESTLQSANIYAAFLATSALSTADKNTEDKINQNISSIRETSGKWNDAFSEISSTSANYRSAYTSFSSNSGKWDDVYTTTNSISSTWNNAFAYTSSHSAEYETSKVKWDDTYTTVASHSAAWDESSGSTKAYTDMIGTSALTSAKKYTDEQSEITLESANIYTAFIASSALSTANNYTDTVSGAVYASLSAYSEFTATSALTTAITSAYEYTDISSLALSGILSSYSETVASSALKEANIYSSFLASSALTSACSYTDEVSGTLYSSLSGYAESLASSAISSAKTYTDTVSSLINKTITVEVPWNGADGIDEYSDEFENPINGDVLILKKQLFEGATENFKYTSFTYCSGEWHAMNGDYDTKNVFFTENLTTTMDVGNIKVNPSVGYAVIESKGKNVNKVFEDLFRVAKDPIVNYPSISSVSVTSVGSYESGTIIVPQVGFTTTSASYEFGPISTSDFDSFTASINGQTITIAAGATFSPILLTDAMSAESDTRKMSVQGHYTEDTVVPVNNLGIACPSKKILAGYTEAKKSTECLKSYRQCFYEARTEHTNLAMITSLFIRTLANKTGYFPTEDSVIDIAFPVGKKSVVFAVPKVMSSQMLIIDRNAFGMNVKSAFDSIETNVKDASETNEIPYMVYFKNCADPNDTANTYTIKFKE